MNDALANQLVNEVRDLNNTLIRIEKAIKDSSTTTNSSIINAVRDIATSLQRIARK